MLVIKLWFAAGVNPVQQGRSAQIFVDRSKVFMVSLRRNDGLGFSPSPFRLRWVVQHAYKPRS